MSKESILLIGSKEKFTLDYFYYKSLILLNKKVYFKFINPTANEPLNWFLGISPEGIGFIGMILNFLVATLISKVTMPPPPEVIEMIDNIRAPE